MTSTTFHSAAFLGLFSTLLAAPVQAAAPAEDLFRTQAIADIAELVTPAVVNITTERLGRPAGHPMESHPFFRDFFGPEGNRRTPREMGAGSGVVVSPDGYIVTNNHVIEGADEIKVVFADKREFRANLVGTDKPSDIALIKIDAKGLKHLEFGDASILRLGEFVLAVGNPFGVGQTVTMGIVSAKGRANIGIVDYEDFIQTDAAINPGNSGGAMVNLKGELVGINTAILSRSGGAQGIGFAVPSNMAKPILEQIRKHGKVRRGWMGVAIQDLTPDLAGSLDLKDIEGVLISDVMDKGPAAKAEIQAGDVVVSVDGKPTRSAAQLRNLIAMIGPGNSASLSVFRDGKSRKVRVLLEEKESDQAQATESPAERSLLTGVRLKTLDREVASRLEAPPDLRGVLLSEVEPSTPAADAGLRAGDVLTRVNREDVRSVQDLERMALDKRDRVLLRIWREGHFLFIVLRR